MWVFRTSFIAFHLILLKQSFLFVFWTRINTKEQYLKEFEICHRWKFSFLQEMDWKILSLYLHPIFLGKLWIYPMRRINLLKVHLNITRSILVIVVCYTYLTRPMGQNLSNTMGLTFIIIKVSNTHFQCIYLTFHIWQSIKL